MKYRLILLFLILFGKATAQNPVFLNEFTTANSIASQRLLNSITLEEIAPNASDFALSANGKLLFVLCPRQKTLFSFPLSQAFDLSTAGESLPENNLSFPGMATHTGRIDFSPDGLLLFVKMDNSTISTYNLGTAYSLATANFAGTTRQFTTTETHGNINDVEISPDGTKLLILHYSASFLVEYKLTTPFNLGTAKTSHIHKTLNFGNFEKFYEPRRIKYGPTGSKLYLCERQGYLRTFELLEPYELASAKEGFKGIFIQGLLDGARSVFFGNQGKYLFATPASGTYINAYTLPVSVPVNEGTTFVIDIDAAKPGSAVADNVSYSLEGRDSDKFTINDKGEIHFKEAPDYENPRDRYSWAPDNTYGLVVIAKSETGRALQYIHVPVRDVADTPVIKKGYAGNFDFSHLDRVEAEENYSVYQQALGFHRLLVTPDGRELFTLRLGGISAYEMSDAYSLSYAGNRGLAAHFVYSPYLSPRADMIFSTDGMFLYLVGIVDGKLTEYSLSAPYDISQATETGKVAVINELVDVRKFKTALSQDGTKLFASTGRYITEYQTSVPYDFTSYKVSNRIKVQEDLGFYSSDNIETFSFIENGRKLVTLEGNLLRVFNLSSPFDLGTLSYAGDNKQLRLTGMKEITDLEFAANGTLLFALDGENSKIYKYAIGSTITFEENAEEAVIDVDAYPNAGGNPDDVTYSLQGIDADKFTINSSGVVQFINTPDYENPADQDQDNIYQFMVVASNGQDDTETGYTVAISDADDLPYFANAPKAGYVLKELEANGEFKDFYLDGEKTSVNWKDGRFNEDGTKMFVLSGKRVSEYRLGTSFDITTAVYSGRNKELHLPGRPSLSYTSILFSNDGSLFYTVTEDYSDRFNIAFTVHTFTLKDNYDLSRAVYLESSGQFTAAKSGDIRLRFNDDGTRLFIFHENPLKCAEYKLPQPFRIQSPELVRSDVLNFIYERLFVNSVEFSKDGMAIYVSGRNSLYDNSTVINNIQYQLGEKFKPATATDKKAHEVYRADAKIYELAIADEGSRIYINEEGTLKQAFPGGVIYASTSSQSHLADLMITNKKGGTSEGLTYTLSGPDQNFFKVDGQGRIYNTTELYKDSLMDANMDDIYEIVLTADNGEHNRSKVLKIVLDEDLGQVTSVSTAPELKIYPIPANRLLKIETRANLQEIVILNLSGNLVKRFSEADQLEVTDLPDGIYFLKLLTKEGQLITRKISIAHN